MRTPDRVDRLERLSDEGSSDELRLVHLFRPVLKTLRWTRVQLETKLVCSSGRRPSDGSSHRTRR